MLEYRIEVVKLKHYRDWAEQILDFSSLIFRIIIYSNTIDNEAYKYMYCQDESQSYTRREHKNKSDSILDAIAKNGRDYREIIISRDYDKSILKILRNTAL